MKAPVLWLATAVGWIVLLGALAQENCMYMYTEQPPDSLNCRLEDKLQLKCTAIGPRGSRLGMVWFRDSMQLQNSSVDVIIQETSNTMEGSIVSILRQGNLDNNLGSYHCQLSVNGSTSQTLPSDSFQITDISINDGTRECPAIPHFKAEAQCASLNVTVLPTPSVAATYTSQLSMTPTTQTPMMSLPSLNTSPLHTPSLTDEPSTSLATTSDMVTDGSTNASGGGTTLQVWLYVVVAIAAVFAMIIIILVILCVGLCLRKSKTADMETQKEQEQQGLHEQFSTIGTSEVLNGLDQRHPDIKGDFTTTTQLTNHSQSITVPETSDYNILGERDYEVINIVHTQPPEYHHLQRPSMQRSRAATFGFSSTGNGIRDMRSMTSVTSASTHATTQELMRGDSTTAPLPPPKEGKMAMHPHRNLNFVREQGENMALHNPTVRPSVENSQSLERDESTTQLLPNSSMRSRTSYQTSNTLESDVHESLYSPPVGILPNNPVFYHALENIPETGTMFPEPSYPSAFPVHEYDYIPTGLSHYETPVPSKKGTSSFPTATLATTLSSDYAEGFTTGNTTAGFAYSTLSSDYPKSSITGFTGSDTADFTGGSTPDYTADSTTDITAGSAPRRNVNGDSTSNVPGMIEFTASTGTSKSLPEFANVASVDGHDNLRAKYSTINPTFIVRENNGVVDNSTCTETSDFSGPIIFPHMLHGETRRNHYKKLDPATMEPVLKYAKINVAQKTDV